MGEFTEMELEDVLDEFARADSHADGCSASAMAGLIGASLCRKVLDFGSYSPSGTLSEDEEKAIRWELDDSIAHFEKLLDKNHEAFRSVREIESGKLIDGFTADEIYRSALSVAAAVAVGAARVAEIAHKLSLLSNSHRLSDIGCALQLLYASFVGAKMKMNDYFTHVKSLDEDFVCNTRGKVQELEDVISQLIGPGLKAVWDAIDPKAIEGVST